jgi:hypothetical protein
VRLKSSILLNHPTIRIANEIRMKPFMSAKTWAMVVVPHCPKTLLARLTQEIAKDHTWHLVVSPVSLELVLLTPAQH